MEHHWREPSGRQKFLTVSARLHWSYANLAMAHAALNSGAKKYGPFPYYQIRAKLFAGLNSGTMAIGLLLDDERLKVLSSAYCAYCGKTNPDTVDHLLPRAKGGDHRGENLVACCRDCNSAKSNRDVMAWHRKMGSFPSLSITRRYLKLAALASTQVGLMESPIDSTDAAHLPFDVMAVPMIYPTPDLLFWSAAERPTA